MTRKEAAELRREAQELREEVARLRCELASRPPAPQYVPVPTMPHFPWPPLPVIAGTSAEPLPQPTRVWCGSIDITGGCAGPPPGSITFVPFGGATP